MKPTLPWASRLVGGDRGDKCGGGLKVGGLMLRVDVQRDDAEVVRGSDLDDVRVAHGGVVLGHEGAEGVAQLLEQLGVTLEHRLAEEDVVVAGGGGAAGLVRGRGGSAMGREAEGEGAHPSSDWYTLERSYARSPCSVSVLPSSPLMSRRYTLPSTVSSAFEKTGSPWITAAATQRRSEA